MDSSVSPKDEIWFKVCKSVHHHTIQIHQPTRCNNFSSLLLGVYVQLNMFQASSCPSSGATTIAVAASGLPPELGASSAVARGRPDHEQQHCYHNVPMVNQRLLLLQSIGS
jgi:hypothetical protein